jgi:hypothetical protein
MRIEQRRIGMRSLGAAAVLALASFACQNSNAVTAPASAEPATSIIGEWSGTYVPASATCPVSTASATFRQDGAEITGILNASSCGVSGSFRGKLVSGQLVGRIEMRGCSGGGVSGTVTDSGLSLAIGDITRPLVTADEVVMFGGTAELHR